MSHRRLTALLLAGLACVSLFSQSSPAQTGATGGISHTLLLIGGEVWTAGSNYFGQIGVGAGPARRYRTPVAQGVVAVAAGAEHSLALKSDGTLLAWGHGSEGSLGIVNPGGHKYVPSVVPVSGVVAIGAAVHRSYAVTSGGNVLMFGSGYLGDGYGIQNKYEPTQVSGVTDAADVAVGSSHVLVLKADKTVVAWGENHHGQLGDGTTTAHYSPQPVPGLTDIVQIAAGNVHSVALNSSGQVYAWGYNDWGAVGDGTTVNKLSPVLLTSLSGLTITKISAGWRHTLALASNGTVRGWGGTLPVKLATAAPTSCACRRRCSPPCRTSPTWRPRPKAASPSRPTAACLAGGTTTTASSATARH
jgi:alpha-tubulin suppressor-like RCC1 family protein